MFDYDGFNPFDEDGILGKHQVDVLRKRLEDLVDRLYVENEEISNDEIDLDIREMANILGVYVPHATVSIKLKQFGAEYIEDVINAELYPVKKLYRGWNPNAAFQFLKTVKVEKDHDVLSVGDIADFCFSEYFKQKCEEEGNVF